MEDQELINAIVNYQNGIDPEENFSFIYQRTIYYVERKVRSYFGQRKASAYDIEDVVQDVFLGVVRNIGALEEPRAFFSWLDTIANNSVKNLFKSKQGKTIVRETSSNAKVDDEEDKPLTRDIEDLRVKSNPELSAFQTNTVMVVREIIDSLTDAQKDALIPSYLYQLSDQEIADKLGINLNTYKSRKKSAMDALARKKAEFKKRGVEIAVIPFVLLLHVACRSDETLAATLTAGMAASGIAKAKATQAAATGAVKVATSTSGLAGSAASAAGVSGATKVAGTGIAVKAAVTVATVVVIAGGTFVYKTSKQEKLVEETTSAVINTSIEAAVSPETTTAEETGSPGVYASAYGSAVEDYATTFGVSIEDVVVLLADLDNNGTVEMCVYTSTNSSQDITNDSLYTMDNDGTATFLIHKPWLNELIGENGGIYVWGCDEANGTQELYTMDGTSLTLVMSAPYTTTLMDGEDISDISDTEIELNDFLMDSDPIPMTKITYDQLISLSDEQIMEISKD